MASLWLSPWSQKHAQIFFKFHNFVGLEKIENLLLSLNYMPKTFKLIAKNHYIGETEMANFALYINFVISKLQLFYLYVRMWCATRVQPEYSI
jgi:hypothetical protein